MFFCGIDITRKEGDVSTPPKERGGKLFIEILISKSMFNLQTITL